MYRIRLTTVVIMVAILTTLCMYALADDVQTFSPSELDNIFAPIALYSDPLLAQILPAATFPDQLSDAENFIQSNGDAGQIDEQNWDVSVQAVAHYPSVLKMMVDDPDWTVAIGQAYVNQPDDVMASIQRLRGKARLMGYLNSNKYQRTYNEGSYIRIVPVDPEYIYVPTYDPDVVYVRHYNGNSLNTALAFGLGLLIGSWLDRDVDWGHHRVFYHGWRGGGWIGNSRSHVDFQNNHYVNSRFLDRPVDVNRTITTRDIGQYRTEVKRKSMTGSHRISPSQIPQSPTSFGTPRSNQGSNFGRTATPGTKGYRSRTTPAYGSSTTPAPKSKGRNQITIPEAPSQPGSKTGRGSSSKYVSPGKTRGNNTGSTSTYGRTPSPSKSAPSSSSKSGKSGKSGNSKKDKNRNSNH